MHDEIRFEGIFGYRQYQLFLRDIARIAGPRRVIVDLSKVVKAHAMGMAPLVASIQGFHQRGWQFDVQFPDDDRLDAYWRKVGWAAGIAGDESPSIVGGQTYLPLSRYTNADELNPLVSNIIEPLSRTTVFAAGVMDGLSWSLNEVADNVLLHAGPGVSGWIQMTEDPKNQQVEMVVVDTGRGIPSSIREAFPNLADDREAVMKAVEQGVTRDPDIGAGNGLAGTMRIANAAGGWANLHSGLGQLRIMPGRDYQMLGAHHQGTLIEVTLPTDSPIDVAEALWGVEPLSELEMNYINDDGFGIHVRVAEEASGFGNRASAKPIRIKVLNLLNRYPDDPITLDFEHVTMLSSSFADELIARLVYEIGTTRYLSRFRLVNLSDLARRTIDAVIAHRVGGR